MMTLFQSEWDALMLETYNIKQQLEQVRQELGHALYQHDAACRVIARLVKERDDARSALAKVHVQTKSVREVPASTTVAESERYTQMTEDVVARFEATSKELSKSRKKRLPPPEQTGPEGIAAFEKLAGQALFRLGPVCLDVHRHDAVGVAGGGDGTVVLLNLQLQSLTASMTAHSKRVNSVCVHPNKPLMLSCSEDNSACVWNTHGQRLHTISMHTAAVTACTLHATGDYFSTASEDKSWALFDLEGRCILHVPGATSGYSCAGFHPDGLILGTGTEKIVRIWDIKSRTNVASFEGHLGSISCLAFSENGYYLATGAADASVKIWDLRKLKNFHTMATAAGETIGSLNFDFTGAYLAVGSADARIYETKSWELLKTFMEDAHGVSGIGFGTCASKCVAAAATGIVQVYGSV
jgi:pre-mRNA-processing factor 19